MQDNSSVANEKILTGVEKPNWEKSRANVGRLWRENMEEALWFWIRRSSILIESLKK